MRVSFESTLDEAVAESVRSTRSAPGQRRIRLGFGVATALVLGAATGARIGGTRGLLAGVLAAVVSLAVYDAAVRALQRWLLRNAWRRALEDPANLHVVVEVRPSGLGLRRGAREAELPWNTVTRAQTTRHGVEISGRNGLLVIVPARAFEPPQAAEEMVRAVNGRAAASP